MKFIPQLIDQLTDNVVLLGPNGPVHPDEYRLLHTPRTLTWPSDGLRRIDPRKFKLTEPRIVMLRDILKALLSAGVFYAAGQQVVVTGFAIKHLKDWLAHYATNPGSVIQLLRKACRVHCVFCYQDGLPRDLPFVEHHIAEQEIWNRVQYFESDRELFPRVVYNVDEVMSHRLLLPVLGALREKTNEPFDLYTNGEGLTQENIQGLARLMPVIVNVSITSTDKDERRRFVRDRNPDIAIRGFDHLREHSIPFVVQVVAWPTIPLASIKRTLRYLDAYQPLYFKILLPGYSRFFKHPFPQDSMPYFKQVIEAIRKFRGELQSDVVFDLQKLEEYFYGLDPLEPRVTIVTPNSPARLAGLRKNDVITAIAGRKVYFRHKTKSMLFQLYRLLQRQDVPLVINRPGEGKMEILLKTAHYRQNHPYYPWQKNLGVFIDDGLDPSVITQINFLIESHNARRVVLLSTRLMRYSMNTLQSQWMQVHHADTFHVMETPNRFWGGNIMVGDLLVVDDFLSAITAAKQTYPDLDLVLLPSSPFSVWQYDLLGRSFFELQRKSPVAVALLAYPRLMS